MKKVILISMIAAVLFSMVACNTKKEDTLPAETTVGQAGFDGNYAGEGMGHGGPVKLDLVIINGEIADIIIGENHETAGLGDNAMEAMKANMIAKNQITVDTVTGATISSKGFSDAVKDAFAKSGASESDLTAKEGTAGLEVREKEYTADVIIVGAGGAGMISAIEAAEAGATVILIEKLPATGGNTLLSGAEMAAPENWLQKIEGTEDNADLMYEDTLKGGDNENDPALVRILADNALAGAEWLRDDINVIFEDYQLFFGGHSVKRSLVPKNASGVEVIAKLNSKVASHNIPVHLNTEAVELIQDDKGRVIGVIATYNGTETTYHADNAVIMATGGFGANIEMRTQYNEMMDEKILSTNSVGSTGDGLIMAEAVGAELVDLSYIQTYPTCDPETGALLYVGDVRMEGRAILVNKEGVRFVEELERRDVISKAVTEQTEGVSYLFWDEASMIESKVNVKHKEEYENLIGRGMMVKVDTIEEAATFFDIPAETLKTTVETYNKYAEAGEDLDFKKRGILVPFTEGSYYIMMSKPAVHHTMGGIRINTEAQVLTAEGEVIKGLYAAGEVTGDIHGTNRLGSNAITDITVFGRIAGKNAATDGKDTQE